MGHRWERGQSAYVLPPHMLSGFTGKVLRVYRDEVVLKFEDLEDPITFRKDELIPGGKQ